MKTNNHNQLILKTLGILPESDIDSYTARILKVLLPHEKTVYYHEIKKIIENPEGYLIHMTSDSRFKVTSYKNLKYIFILPGFRLNINKLLNHKHSI